ncbi:MAG: hypothetical protein ABSG70_07040 [Terriglobales bacterium]|jgi:hypothetical protein
MGLNVNLGSGVVLLVFGIVMFVLGRQANVKLHRAGSAAGTGTKCGRKP